MNTRISKATALLTVCCFTLSVTGYPAPVPRHEAGGAREERTAEDFFMPHTCGRVTDAFAPGGEHPVVLIEDLHCHPGVQRNILGALARLDAAAGIGRIYQEGAAGGVDTLWLEALEDPALRRRAMDSMLEKGELTAAEYYSALPGGRKLLAGMEDGKRYRDNLFRLRALLENRPAAEALLAGMEADAASLEERFYSPANRRVSSLLRRNRQGDRGGRRYYETLWKYARKTGIDFNGYPNVSGYAALLEAGEKLDYSRISVEMDGYLGILRNSLPARAFRLLAERTDNFRRTDELYAALSRRWEHQPLRGQASRFRSLDAFFSYIRLQQRINPSLLPQEERKLVREIRERLSSGRGEREAVFLADFQGLLKGYLTAALSFEEYGYAARHLDEFLRLRERWLPGDGREELAGLLDAAGEYYRVNADRNEDFVRALLGGALPARGERTAPEDRRALPERARAVLPGAEGVTVAVSGGFHTRGVTGLLKKHGVPFLVITPDVPGDTGPSDERYAELIRAGGGVREGALCPPVASSALVPLQEKIARLAGSLLAEACAGSPPRQEIEARMNGFLASWKAAYERGSGTSVGELGFRLREEGIKGELAFSLRCGGEERTGRYDPRRKKAAMDGDGAPSFPRSQAAPGQKRGFAFRLPLTLKARGNPGNIRPGTGIERYRARHPARSVRYLPTIRLSAGDLPYPGGLREVRPPSPPPGELDGIPRCPVRLPSDDIMLVSTVHNGSVSFTRLGFLGSGRPVAVKRCAAPPRGAGLGGNSGRARPFEKVIAEYRGAKTADDLGIGPAVHGIWQDADGEYNLVMDIVPGDFPRAPGAARFITAATFRDLREIHRRLAGRGLDMDFDFQYFVDPNPGEDGQRGHIQIIDQADGIFEPAPADDPTSFDRLRSGSYVRRTASLLLDAAPAVRIQALAEIKDREPALFSALRQHAAGGGKDGGVRELRAACDEVSRGRAGAAGPGTRQAFGSALGAHVRELAGSLGPVLGAFLVSPSVEGAQALLGQGLAAEAPREAGAELERLLLKAVAERRGELGIGEEDPVTVRLLTLSQNELINGEDAFVLAVTGLDRSPARPDGAREHAVVFGAHRVLWDAIAHDELSGEELALLAEHEVDEYLALKDPSSETGRAFEAFYGRAALHDDVWRYKPKSGDFFHAYIRHLRDRRRQGETLAPPEDRLARQAELIDAAARLRRTAFERELLLVARELFGSLTERLLEAVREISPEESVKASAGALHDLLMSLLPGSVRKSALNALFALLAPGPAGTIINLANHNYCSLITYVSQKLFSVLLLPEQTRPVTVLTSDHVAAGLLAGDTVIVMDYSLPAIRVLDLGEYRRADGARVPRYVREEGEGDGDGYFREIELYPAEAAESFYLAETGSAYFKLGDDDRALAYCRRALEKNPDCALVYQKMASHYLSSGDYLNAIECGKKAAQIRGKAAAPEAAPREEETPAAAAAGEPVSLVKLAAAYLSKARRNAAGEPRFAPLLRLAQGVLGTVKAALDGAKARSLAAGREARRVALLLAQRPLSRLEKSAPGLYGKTLLKYSRTVRERDVQELAVLARSGVNGIYVLPFMPREGFEEAGAMEIVRGGVRTTVRVMAGKIATGAGGVVRVLCSPGLEPRETVRLAQWLEDTPSLHARIASLLGLDFKEIRPVLVELGPSSFAREPGVRAAEPGDAPGDLPAGTVALLCRVSSEAGGEDQGLRALLPYADGIVDERRYGQLDPESAVRALVSDVYEPALLRKAAESVIRPGTLLGENILVSALRGQDTAQDAGIGELKDIAAYYRGTMIPAGGRLLQLLPLTSPQEDSPFVPADLFAGDEALVDLAAADEVRSLLKTGEAGAEDVYAGEDALPQVRRERVAARKFALARKASALLLRRPGSRRCKAYEAFCRDNASWLDAYALRFAARRAGADGAAGDPGLLAEYARACRYLQWLFSLQLGQAVEEVHAGGGEVRFWVVTGRETFESDLEALRRWFGFGFDGVRVDIRDGGISDEEHLARLKETIAACRPDAVIAVKLPEGGKGTAAASLCERFGFQRIRDYDALAPSETAGSGDLVEMGPPDAERRPYRRGEDGEEKLTEDILERVERVKGAAGILFNLGDLWGDDWTLLSRDENGEARWSYRVPLAGEVNGDRVKETARGLAGLIAQRLSAVRSLTREEAFRRGYEMGRAILKAERLGEAEKAVLEKRREFAVRGESGAAGPSVAGYGLHCAGAFRGRFFREGAQASDAAAFFAGTLLPLLSELAEAGGENRKCWRALLSHAECLSRRAAASGDGAAALRYAEEALGLARGAAEKAAALKYLSSGQDPLPEDAAARRLFLALVTLADAQGAAGAGQDIAPLLRDFCRDDAAVLTLLEAGENGGRPLTDEAMAAAGGKIFASAPALVPAAVYLKTLLRLRTAQGRTKPAIDSEMERLSGPLFRLLMSGDAYETLSSAGPGAGQTVRSWALGALRGIVVFLSDGNSPEVTVSPGLYRTLNEAAVRAIKAAS